MRKKAVILLTIIIILALAVLLSGCNRVKLSKDYYFYTYSDVLGNFVQNNAKVSFHKDTYTFYNNNGQVINVGNHSTNNGMVSFIPDKIGNAANQVAATTCMYVYKEFLVENGRISSRIIDTQFEDRDELEGVYDLGFKLSKGVIYISYDGSNTDSSFTERMGTYELNRDRDFVIFNNDDGTVDVFLRIKYTDTFGYKVSALVDRFYSYKKPSIKSIKESSVELASKVFVKNSSNSYNLSLMAYPKKNTIDNKNVTYTVLGSTGATISGSTLNFNGTGQLQIEYKYGNIVNREWITIVDIQVKTGLLDAARTFTVGSSEDYDDLLAAVADYYSDWRTYESVIISDTAKAECKEGAVHFKEAGTVNATLVVRYVRVFKDGTKQEVEVTTTIVLLINN